MPPQWVRQIKLRYQTRQLAADLSLQVQVTRRLARDARSRGDKALLAIANFNICLLLFRRDFQFLFTDTLVERDKTKRNFLARQLAISLFDFLERIHSLAKTQIRPTIQSSSLPQTVKDELDAVLGGLGQLKNQHIQYLNDLRNRAGAHRDLDGLGQLEAIEGTDVDKLLAIAQDVSVAHVTLVATWILATETYLERSNFGIQPTAEGRG